jgi:hypothetical protein
MLKRIVSILSISLIFILGTTSPKAYAFGIGDITDPFGEYWGDAADEFFDSGIIDREDYEDWSSIIPESPEIEGATPKLRYFPTALFFGTWPTAIRSVKMPIVFTNDGALPLFIENVEIKGENPEDFRIDDDGCDDKTLGDLDTCTVRISFKPKEVGTRRAILKVSYYKADISSPKTHTEEIKLMGIGLPSEPGDIGDCNFDDLWKGKCDIFDGVGDIGNIGDIFKFSEGNPQEISTEGDSEVVKTASVEPQAGGCSMVVSPSIPWYLFLPFVIFARRFFRK